MRTLLLASAAMLGGTMIWTPLARAQIVSQIPADSKRGDTPLVAPSFGTDVPNWSTNPPLSSANATVRLAGRLTTYFAAVSASTNNPGLITTAPGATPTPANTKSTNYTILQKARLYPSFDAQAANGLRYGAFLEIRADSAIPPGGGANGSISNSTRSRGQLYYVRETAYIGSSSFGYVRYGATDGPLMLYATGTNTNFDSGGWNGDNALNGPVVPIWPFPVVMNEYSTSKVIYLSPRFYDLVDFGVSFEPNTGTVSGSVSGCNGITAAPSAANNNVGTGCDAASSTSVASETARRRNTVEAVLRATTAVGPVGLAATVGYSGSGTVKYNGTPTVAGYDGFNFLDSGAQITYGGLAAGGHIIAGRLNGQWELAPKGGRDALGWTVGGSYVTGPVIVGAQYFNYQSAGAWKSTTVGVARSRNELGASVGGTLTVAPGAYVFLSYLYGQRHQPGVDFFTGVTNARTHNNTVAQAVAVGTQFRW